MFICLQVSFRPKGHLCHGDLHPQDRSDSNQGLQRKHLGQQENETGEKQFLLLFEITIHSK